MNFKLICSYNGGSESYGLQTSLSDEDKRGVFIHTELDKVLDLSRFEYYESTQEQDTKYKEVRHFFNLLRKANSECVESLYITDYLTMCTPEWLEILKYRESFLDSKMLYKCLRGYIQGEKHQILGANTAKLGEKRKRAIEKFGYSNKNCVHALRLLRLGITFFKEDRIVVNVMKHDKDFGDYLLRIKTCANEFKVDKIMDQIQAMEKEMDEAYEKRLKTYVFDDKLANELLLKFYYPVIRDLHQKIFGA